MRGGECRRQYERLGPPPEFRCSSSLAPLWTPLNRQCSISSAGVRDGDPAAWKSHQPPCRPAAGNPARRCLDFAPFLEGRAENRNDIQARLIAALLGLGQGAFVQGLNNDGRCRACSSIQSIPSTRSSYQDHAVPASLSSRHPRVMRQQRSAGQPWSVRRRIAL